MARRIHSCYTGFFSPKFSQGVFFAEFKKYLEIFAYIKCFTTSVTPCDNANLPKGILFPSVLILAISAQQEKDTC